MVALYLALRASFDVFCRKVRRGSAISLLTLRRRSEPWKARLLYLRMQISTWFRSLFSHVNCQIAASNVVRISSHISNRRTQTQQSCWNPYNDVSLLADVGGERHNRWVVACVWVWRCPAACPPLLLRHMLRSSDLLPLKHLLAHPSDHPS